MGEEAPYTTTTRGETDERAAHESDGSTSKTPSSR